MIRTILLPTVFEAGSRPAEEFALELAKKHGARVLALHAIEPIDAGEDEESVAFYDSLRERAEPRMEAVATRFREADVECATRVEVGRRWKVIVDTATQEGVDLIVMGSRFFIENGRPRLGTTSHQVFLAAGCPVLFARVHEGGS